MANRFFSWSLFHSTMFCMDLSLICSTMFYGLTHSKIRLKKIIELKIKQTGKNLCGLPFCTLFFGDQLWDYGWVLGYNGLCRQWVYRWTKLINKTLCCVWEDWGPANKMICLWAHKFLFLWWAKSWESPKCISDEYYRTMSCIFSLVYLDFVI